MFIIVKRNKIKFKIVSTKKANLRAIVVVKNIKKCIFNIRIQYCMQER